MKDRLPDLSDRPARMRVWLRRGCAVALAAASFASGGEAAVDGQSPAAAAITAVVVSAGALDRWPGPAKIRRELTPLEVTVENRGKTPVLLAYARLRLVGRDGRVFRALPLFPLQASQAGAPILKDPFEVRDVLYHTSGFKLAPVYRKAYRGIAAADRPVGLDPSYYALYQSYYAGKPLPTTGMRRRGIPEGVIEPGGQAQGYLFFEEVPRSARPVALRYELVDPATGEVTGTVSAPVED